MTIPSDGGAWILKFEFAAGGRGLRDDGDLTIAIGAPLPVEGFPNNFVCAVVLTGVVNKEMRAFGAYPLQAVDLAIQMAKAVASSYANEWDFHADGQGPIIFDYTI